MQLVIPNDEFCLSNDNYLAHTIIMETLNLNSFLVIVEKRKPKLFVFDN